MIKKIYDRDTGNIYDVGGSERKVLTLDDINPEIVIDEDCLDITLNDRDYNNKHIVIDCGLLLEDYQDLDILCIRLWLCEKNKNCTIQFVNITTEGIIVNGGITIHISNYFFDNTLTIKMNHIISAYGSYLESPENIDGTTSSNYAEFITSGEEHYYNMVSLITDIDSYGNVDLKPIMNFEC